MNKSEDASADGTVSELLQTRIRAAANASETSQIAIELSANVVVGADPFQESHERTQRVILVDDNSSMRSATRLALEELGFEVEAFANGNQALAAITRDNRPISLLITDFNMPGLTGYELAQLVHLERPEIPILIASGNDENSILAGVDPVVRPSFIQKPYSLRNLARKIREMLNVAPSELPSSSMIRDRHVLPV